MLLSFLVVFGLLGIAVRSVPASRSSIALLVSAGSIAFISPASLLACLFLALINFAFLKRTKRGAAFIAALLVNILSLFTFHLYANLGYTQTGLPEILGISYLVLQLIDQLCKVRFGITEAPANFLSHLATVFYFPKFFSGPIASLPEVEKQLHSADKKNELAYGLNRILLGLFKKLVLAESLSLSVHSVLDFNESYPGLAVLTGALLYTLQLYFDFSGYSDMAIGASALWGVTLPENFIFPFRQRSWSGFWKSWHSSLTGWLWQYVFNPLYIFFSRQAVNRIFALLICSAAVFAAMAFFNGLHTGFYISAGIYAFLYFCEVAFSARKSFLYAALIFVCFSVGLIFFRDAAYDQYAWLGERLLDFDSFIPSDWARTFFAPLAYGGTLQDFFNLGVTLSLCLLFLLFERRIADVFFRNRINYMLWLLAMLLLFTWGVFTGTERFIYMQF